MSDPAAPKAPSSPMDVPLFRALWIGASISNLGTWIQDVGQGWLMTSLSPSPLWVALVNTSVMLPGVLLALPAGVLADLVDRRRLLIVTQSFMSLSAAALAVLSQTRFLSPVTLLCGTLAMGLGTAINSPTWQAVMPDVVPRPLLGQAVVWNGVAWNAARAIGPALGGLLVASLGPVAAFALNSVSFLVTIMVLLRWRPAPVRRPGPPESFFSAVAAGLRFVRHNGDLRTVIGRAGMFSLFAPCGLALLPFLARVQLGGGASTYGVLLACTGVGALTGAALRSLGSRLLRAPVVVPAGMALVALALVTLGHTRSLLLSGASMGIFGMGWLWVYACANTAAQLALPVWVRARGMGIYLLVVSGTVAAGSAMTGRLADEHGLELAFTVSAIGVGIGALLSIVAPLPDESTARDLTTWAWSEAPRIGSDLRGPVLVMLRYPLAEDADLAAARHAVRRLAGIRLRDGATSWRLYENPDDPRALIEVYSVGSWAEHLRQHERGTVADREVFRRAEEVCGGGRAEVIHLVAAP